MQYIPPLQSTQSKAEQLTPTAYGVAAKALQDNYLYVIDEVPALTSLVFTLAEGFHYCTIDFKTGSTAPTFGLTSGFSYLGADCSSTAFTPRARRHYRLALQFNGLLYFCFVEEVKE